MKRNQVARRHFPQTNVEFLKPLQPRMRDFRNPPPSLDCRLHSLAFFLDFFWKNGMDLSVELIRRMSWVSCLPPVVAQILLDRFVFRKVCPYSAKTERLRMSGIKIPFSPCLLPDPSKCMQRLRGPQTDTS